MSEVRLVSERNPNPADVEPVRQGLYRFNMQTMNEWEFLDITILLRDDANAVQGGIIGSVWSGWFHIEFLWIADAYRHQGYCLLYTSDAADEEDSVDLGGRRIIN